MAPGGEATGTPLPGLRGLVRLGQAGGVLFVAKVGAAGLSFIILAFLARILGPASFGDFTLLRILFMLLVGLLGPAIDTALVRFGARELVQCPDRFAPTVRAALHAKAMLAIAFIVGGIVLAYPVRSVLFDPDSPIRSVHIAIVFWGAAAMLFVDLLRALLQTQQRFAAYAVVEFLVPVLRAGAVAGLAGLGFAIAGPYLVAYVAAPAALVLVLWRIVARSSGDSTADSFQVAGDLRRFAGWVLVACVCTSIAQNADMLILGLFPISRESVGGYGAARTMMQVGDLAVLSLFSVFLPYASGLNSSKAMARMLRVWTPGLGVCCLLTVPLLFHMDWAMAIVFGEPYAGFGAVLAVLLAGTLVSVVSAPAGAVVYGAGYPRIIALLEGIKLITLVGGGAVLVSRYGIWGMACTMATVKGTIGVLTFGAAVWVTGKATQTTGEPNGDDSR